MPRKPNVRYFDSRKGYYCQLDGKQHKLASGPDDAPSGPCYSEALENFKALMELHYVPLSRDRSPVRAVLETYLVHLESSRSASTLRIRTASFLPFAEFLGDRAIAQLSPSDLDRFIAQMRRPRDTAMRGERQAQWGDCSVRFFLAGLSAALNWAVKRGHISRNPVAGYESPSSRNRTARCLIPEADHVRILAACEGSSFRHLLMALENTGARTGELMGAEARDWDDKLGAIVYRGDDKRREDDFRHKTAYTDRDRVIYFTGEALEMVRGLVKRYPTGPLFRNHRGHRWTQSMVNNRLKRLRETLHLPYLIATGYRHTLATRWLESGRSVDLLAEIMGNTPQAIRNYYRHINPQAPAVQAALQDFRGRK